jgi:hypothetical protein
MGLLSIRVTQTHGPRRLSRGDEVYKSRVLALVLLLAAASAALSQESSLEYRVKAVYLFNFVKFVEWPAPADTGPVIICVAGRNPFGGVLEETLKGEVVKERPLTSRVILEPDPGCHVLFVPRGAGSAFLGAARGSAMLTVGETPGFLSQGGIINFIVEEGKVRFEIDPKAAERADLHISSHLLRMSRGPDRSGKS